MSMFHKADQGLAKHSGASKTARFWTMWQQGSIDYMKIRDQLFGNMLVDELYAEIVMFQKQKKLNVRTKKGQA